MPADGILAGEIALRELVVDDNDAWRARAIRRRKIPSPQQLQTERCEVVGTDGIAEIANMNRLFMAFEAHLSAGLAAVTGGERNALGDRRRFHTRQLPKPVGKGGRRGRRRRPLTALDK